MKTKVLHIITDLSPDGAQRTLLRLVAALPKSVFDTRVVSLMSGGHLVERFEALGVPVLQLGMRRGLPGPRTLSRLRRVIADFRPDVIQGWMYHGNLAALAGARLARSDAPVAWNIRRCLYEASRDKPLTRLVVRAGARLSRFADAIVYCVGVAADQHEAIGFDRSRRSVITNGFDLSRFSPKNADRQWLHSLLEAPADAPLVGIVGRYHPQKDYPTFLRAAALVARKRPDVRFVMVGRGVTAETPEAASLIAELGLEGRVHLLGERQDLPRIVASLDLFVSSSENEGFSNVVSEAMASGVPCVATDAGASAELLAGFGTVVPRRDPEALAQAVLRTLGLEQTERSRLGNAGRERIVSRYSLEAMVARYSQLYLTLASVEQELELKAA